MTLRKKKKNLDEKQVVLEMDRPAPAVQNETTNNSTQSQGPQSLVFAFLLLVGAFFLVPRHDIPLFGKILLVSALAIQVFRLLRYTQIPILRKIGFNSTLASNGSIILFILILACFSIVLLEFPGFSWMVPSKSPISINEPYWLLLALWVGLVISFKIVPERLSNEDISPGLSRLILFTALGLGVFLPLYRGFSAMGPYGEYEAGEILDVRKMADLGDFSNSFIFSQGNREPFFGYFSLFVWKLFPWLTSLMTQRIAGVALDFITLWVVYLIGRELVNRRVGIWAVALAAVSKPLIMRTLQGMSIQSITLGVALSLLFFLRLIRNPNRKNFIFWGLALSFGMYTYTPYSVFIPFFIFLALGWVWVRENKAGLMNQSSKYLLSISAVLIFGYFLYVNAAFPENNWISYLNDMVFCSSSAILLAIYWTLVLFAAVKTQDWAKTETWFSWITVSWLCVVLTFPIMANESIMGTVRAVLIDPKGFLSWSYLQRAGIQSISALQMLFFTGNDRLNMFIPNDSLFGYSEVVLIAVGLAYAVAKLNWQKALLLAMAIIGFSPYVLTQGAHSGRLLGCVLPLLILGALGLEGFWLRISRISLGKWGITGFCLLLVGFWAWTTQEDVARIYDQWFSKFQSKYSRVERQAGQEITQGKRVYLSSALDGPIAAAIYEGHPPLLLHSSNTLFQDAKVSKPVEILVYLDMGDTVMKDRIQREYPNTLFSQVKNPDPNSGEGPVAWRCLIPSGDILAANEKYNRELERYTKKQTSRPLRFGGILSPAPVSPLFETRSISMPYWERRFSPGYDGLGFGILDGEDWSANAHDPLPSEINSEGEVVRLEGAIHIKQGNRYDITLKADGRTKVWIDGRIIWDVFFTRYNKYPDGYMISPAKTLDKTIRLETGDHRVEIVTCFQSSRSLPEILFRKENVPVGKETSIWSSFDL